MARYYVSIPYGWVDAESPMSAVKRLVADDPATNHEGVTFLVRDDSGQLCLIVVGDDDEPAPVTQAVMDDWAYLFR